ncbi:hypothetical protein, partial [Pseudomonas sp. 2995-1]|uniref:hypothetical protein n=1 Tax=Pseudomonas sp. 2995-1 TaxID=1712679 RepID=UPI00117A10A3
MLYRSLSNHGFSYKDNIYSLDLNKKAGGKLKLINSLEDKKINFSFPQEVSMEDCQKIHNIIVEIAKLTDGIVDGSDATLDM